MMKRDFSFDVLRAVAIVCVIAYHFFLNGQHIYPDSLFFGNIDAGHIGVTLFLALSGAVLTLNYDRETFDLKKFAIKRFWGIYPLFWISYIFIYLLRKIINPAVFAPDIPKRHFLLTILGIDGIFSYRTATFYLIGEWYLGCILILYILFPLLLFCIKKQPVISGGVLVAMHLAVVHFYPVLFTMPIVYNPLVRLLEFTFGIYYGLYIYKKHLVFSVRQSLIVMGIALAGLLSMFYMIPALNIMNRVAVCGLFGFIGLMEVGRFIKQQNMKAGITWISSVSFSVFLIHHQIQGLIERFYLGSEISRLRQLFIFAFYLITVFLYAYMLKNISAFVVRFLKRGLRRSKTG